MSDPNILPEAEQLRIARDPRFKHAGEDTAKNALFGTQQGRFNRKHILTQPAEEKPIRYRSYSEMPAARGHRY
jgi:hypothetical protein